MNGGSVHRILDYKAASEDDEDEDEETLQLRLEALEAKLKLKRLQAKKARGAFATVDYETEQCVNVRSSTRADSVVSSQHDRAQRRGGLVRAKSSESVQVPFSPEKRRVVTDTPRSPGRVLLGIDKGLRGKNVSLRRPPKKDSDATIHENPFTNTLCPRSSNLDVSTIAPGVARSQEQKSFSQRIAETRQQDKDLKEHKRHIDRLRRQRSTGFGLTQSELDTLKATSAAMNHKVGLGDDRPSSDFSREDVIKAFNHEPSGLVTRVDTLSRVRHSRQPKGSTLIISRESIQRPKSVMHMRASPPSEPSAPNTRSQLQPKRCRQDLNLASLDPGLYEPFSSTDLSKRVLPHTLVVRTLENKVAVVIPSLFRDIKSPDFSLPRNLEESDFVVFGTIASKSSPLSHKDARVVSTDSSVSSLKQAAESETNSKGKYMVFTLTDLQWTLDLYLFTTAYTRFWKLTPGTVIAILNPDIMPPPPGKADTGRWSLALNSSDDTILEIGTARHLGFCKSIKKDGNGCGSWVDARKTEYCEWHVDRAVEKSRRGRMEVQGMSAPFAPGGRRGGRTGMFGGRRKLGDKESDGNGLLKEGRQYDRGTHSSYFIAPNISASSTASLLDADEDGLARGMNKEEALRRRLAEREKERDIGRRLGEAGNGTGAEYLRLRHGNQQSDGTDQAIGKDNAIDAGALGLLDNKAQNVQLSPLKRKSSGIDRSSAKKKTRFVTARGIREAGRESFGVVAGKATDHDKITLRGKSPEEDDLDIV